FSHTSGQKTMLVLCIAYYVLFLIATLFAAKINTRSTWAGIVLNITTFFTFLVPLFLALVYYEEQDELYRYPKEYPPGYFETKETVLLCAEVGGIILFLVLLQPFFKRLYRSWFAKPEE
ncbi:MAG: hypothetical protein GXC73_11255, partial [Chitinophagaceae bacterium]|nr:hypothetical protein [Chitinophagaceae bacterium]